MSKKVVIASACRTAVGSMGGQLSTVPAAEMGAVVIKEALKRAGVAPEQVDHVYMGCVIQAGLGQNVARQMSLKAGLPVEVPAVTLNVVCGSGLNAVNAAASQQKACAAIEAGRFKDEIVPIEVKKKKETVIVDTDEGPRPGSTVEILGKLRPAFKKDGRVTAGNASSINDGAAAVVVMSEEKAKELGIKPMATWVAGALGGVDPSIMGIGPVAATKKVLKKTGWKVEDFDLIEANEAFAAQSIAVARDLGFNKDILNVNGGAIAIGHPVGASGCRILTTLLYEMQKRDAKKGLATLCIGGGMGCATIVERD